MILNSPGQLVSLYQHSSLRETVAACAQPTGNDYDEPNAHGATDDG